MKVWYVIAEDEGIDVNRVLTLPERAAQTSYEQSQGFSLVVGEIAQPGRMALRLDEEIAQICRPTIGTQPGVPGSHNTVVVDSTTGLRDLPAVLATDEAFSRFVAYH
jgi:hypothetical protein